ncbi:MAG: hypothetical protein NTZ90_15205 [Proteobacteria bacterium]|nr:hypothetical protein [Pseudomonadota bacterium]
MNEAKEKNLKVFKKELPRLLSDQLFANKFIVVHDEKIVGSYDSFAAALKFAAESLPHDEFIIQRAVDESKVVNFLSVAG